MSTVLADPCTTLGELFLWRVLTKFAIYEAAAVASVSKAWRDAVARVHKARGYEVHLAIVCSKTNRCVLLGPGDGGDLVVRSSFAVVGPPSEGCVPSL